MASRIPQKARDVVAKYEALQGHKRGTKEYQHFANMILSERMWKAIYEVWSEFVYRPKPLPFWLSWFADDNQPVFENAVRISLDSYPGEVDIFVDINPWSEDLVIESWLDLSDGESKLTMQLNTGYHGTNDINDLCRVIESKKFRTRFRKSPYSD